MSTPAPLSLTLFLAAAGLSAGPPILVQSVPAGTDLALPGLPRTAEVWVDMIRGARNAIDLEHFYVASAPGRALEPVLEALEGAAARGVKLRILLSERLQANDPAALARLKAIPGAELRLHAFPGPARGVQHAKFFIVDDREVFLGSQNLDWRSLEHIHETGIRLDSRPVAARMKAIFELDWGGPLPARGLPPSGPEDPDVLASPPHLLPEGVRPTLPTLLDLLGRARTHIRIQLLTYAPLGAGRAFWPVLDNALRAAALRGVAVQLLVSDWNLEEHLQPHLKSLALVPGLEVRVVSLPEDPHGFIPFARVVHSKYVRVDDSLSLLSTSNWSEDYFTGSRNVEWLFRDPALARQLDGIFDKVWTSPHALRLDPCRAYTPRRRE